MRVIKVIRVDIGETRYLSVGLRVTRVNRCVSVTTFTRANRIIVKAFSREFIDEQIMRSTSLTIHNNTHNRNNSKTILTIVTNLHILITQRSLKIPQKPTTLASPIAKTKLISPRNNLKKRRIT